MRKNIFLFVLFIISLILLGCKKENVSIGKNELLTAENDITSIIYFFNSKQNRYKEYDSKNDCYLRVDDDEILCEKLQIIYTQEDDQGKYLYVVESAIHLDQDGTLLTSHLIQGVVTLFLLRRTGNDIEIISQSEDVPNGSYGTPNPVKTYRQGNGKLRGWILTGGDVHGGHLGTTISLFLQNKKEITFAAHINTLYDDSNSCFPDDSDCLISSMSTNVETVYSLNAKYFDLKIDTHGFEIKKGREKEGKFIDKNFIVKFNESKFSYDTDEANKLYEGFQY